MPLSRKALKHNDAIFARLLALRLYAARMGFLDALRRAMRKKDVEAAVSPSIVLLMRKPFFLGKDALR